MLENTASYKLIAENAKNYINTVSVRDIALSISERIREFLLSIAK